MAGCDIHSVYTGIAGSHVRSLNSHGIVGIRDGEVGPGDVERVIEAARAVPIATSNAADDDTPAPTGRLAQTANRRPGQANPACFSAHAIPEAYRIQFGTPSLLSSPS